MGTQNDEIGTFERLITETYPKGIVSIVSDTWDFWKVITEYLPALKSKVMARDGKLVIRPDSGDPVKIICGDPDAVPETPEAKGALECLYETFGGKVNSKGYKALDPHIGLIYGDSITLDRCTTICQRLKEKGFTSTNIVFGIGSYTYQYVTRDTFGFAMKATYGEVNGEGREIYKDPKTDDGTKKSARGLISIYKNEMGELEMFDRVTKKTEENGELSTVFINGNHLEEATLNDIRNRLLDQIYVKALV